MSADPIAVSLGEAAAMVGISRRHALNLAAVGQFPGAYRMGRRWLVHLEVFRAEMARRAQEGKVS